MSKYNSLGGLFTAIANAIRAKTGGTDPIVAEDFPEAVEGISAGGGDIDALIDGSLTEITSNAESVKESTFVGCNALTSVNFPSAKSIGSSACARCQSLTSVNFPSAQSIGSSAFTNISNLTSVNFPSAKSIASNVFNACPNLLSANLPSAESIGSNAFLNCGRLVSVNLSSATTINGNAFQYCYKLSHVDLPCAIQIGANAFASCSDLGSLVLRAATICTLSNSNAINYTKIAKATGYIYVPRALIEDYKAATNWVTFADQFRALEDYTVDGTTTGELDESKVSL